MIRIPQLASALLAFVLIINGVPSRAQSEKEIVSKLRIALKKSVHQDKVQTLSITGGYQINGIEFSGGFYYKQPRQFRGQMQLGEGFKMVMVANDSMQWQYNSGNKEHTIKRYDKDEFSEENDPFEFAKLDLLQYKERGHKLTLLGKVKMDSVEVYELELKLAGRATNRQHLKFFINTKSHLVYKIEDHRGFRHYSNYIVTDGYVYPTRMVQSHNETTILGSFKELLFNKTLADSLFTIPKEAFKYKEGQSLRYESLMARGDSLYGAGLFKMARQAYQEAASIQPDNYRPHNASGMAKLQQKAYYEAVSDFNMAIELDSTAAQPINNRGLAKFYIGDINGAVTDYEKAIIQNPNLKAAYKNKGLALMRLEKYNEAVVDFQRAIEIDTTDGDSFYKHAVALAQLGRYNEAEKAYENAIQRNIKTDELYNYRGVTLYNLKKYDGATLSFSQAFELNQKNLQALENFIRTLYHIEKYEACLAASEKYIEIKSDNPEIHNLKGLSRYYMEDFKGSTKDISRAIELNANSATYHANRALAKQGADDFEGAIADYSKSISLYPNDASIFYKRGLLKIHTSKKIEGCLDLGTANEMNYDPAKEAIMKHCN